MNSIKITELNELVEASVNDLVPIVDVETGETKKIKAQALSNIGGVAGVVNAYSTSKTDTYSCDYLNPKILWTNPNPTSAFAPQTITLNSDDYDMYEIIWRRQTTTTNYGYLHNTGKIPYSLVTIAGKQILLNSNYSREYTMPNKTSMDFLSPAFTGGTVNDSYAVPLCVIGYKTGLFNNIVATASEETE